MVVLHRSPSGQYAADLPAHRSAVVTRVTDDDGRLCWEVELSKGRKVLSITDGYRLLRDVRLELDAIAAELDAPLRKPTDE